MTRRREWNWNGDEDDDKGEELERTILPGMSEDEIERIVRHRVKKREEKKREFFIHLVIYLIVNIGIWSVWLTDPEFPWPIFVSGGWGIGLFAHATEVWQSLSRNQSRRDAIIAQEVEREKERLGIYSKPKRESLERRKPMRVSDDGELQPLDALLEDRIDDVDDDAETPRYRQNNRRG
jgi:hypothetical protein